MRANKLIVLCANTSWYLFNFRRSTLVMLLEEGWRVVTVSGDSEYRAKLQDLGVEHRIVSLAPHSVHPIKEAISFLHFWWIFRERPSLVLNFTPKCNAYSCLAAAVRGIPSINNISGMGRGVLSKGILGSLILSVYKLASRVSKFTYFQNADDQEFFLSKLDLAAEKSILIPGSGINLEEFKYVPMTMRPVTRFGIFTRIIEEKGVRLFVEAARVLKKRYSVEFVLAGSLDANRLNTISREEVESWEAEGVVSFLGKLDDVRAALAACDCIVLPSYYPEGTPRVLIEAAAIGRPIITTDHSGCRDTVNRKSGYLIELKSVESLMAAMERFMDLSYHEKCEMSRHSRIHAEDYFDENIILTSYKKSIHTVCYKHTK